MQEGVVAMQRRTRVVAVTAACVVLAGLGACSSGGSSGNAQSSTTVATAPIPAPAGLPDFYAVPQPLPAQPGTLLKSEPLAIDGLQGTAYRVMYTSQGLDGAPVAVTGLVAVPDGTPPAGGYPVVSWAHGTNGMGDTCAPSLAPKDEIPLANALLAKGWVVTATDYRGEGTPGLHPYIAGIAAARDSIDIVRAARELDGVDAGTDYVVWGHSQGGHTAMHVSNIGEDYAPELQLDGVVAGAPPSQFNLIYDYLRTSPYKYYLLMAAGGLNAAYGDMAPLADVLTPEGLALLPQLEACSGAISAALKDVDVATVSKGDPFKTPSWNGVLTENDPRSFTKPGASLLIIHGGNDEQIPVVSSKLLSDQLCPNGQDLERWVYPGQSHAGVIAPSANDMIGWIGDRFAGKPTRTLQPTGQADIDVIRCPTA